jgi:hypothetical protein
MKKAVMAGIIGGFLAGVSNFVLAYIGLNMEGSILSYRLFLFVIPDSSLTIAFIEITLGIMWGVIFGAFYAFFYDYIPGIGVKKGFIFSLILWTAGSLRPATLSGSHGYGTPFVFWALAWALVGFFSTCILYGLTLGYLYKK